jgi:hypothetical protein
LGIRIIKAHKMKLSIPLCFFLATGLAVPAAAAGVDARAKIHHRHAHRHMREAAQPSAITRNATPQVPPPSFVFPAIAPYPSGQGDEDGLSRHIGDCNKGCIGGNPG